jgi:hypothetical protein
MADNVIEVILRSVVENADQIPAFAKSLEQLAKQGVLTGTQLNQLSAALDTINKKFGSKGVAEFSAGLTEGIRKGAAEFTKGGGQIVTATDQIVRAQTAAAGTTGALIDHVDSLHGRTLGLGRVLTLAAVNLADFGPAGQIASNAVLQVATSGAKLGSTVGVLSGAIGIITTVMALWISHLQEAKKKKEELDTALRTGDMAFFQKQIVETDAALAQLGTRMDDVRARQAAEAAAGVKPGGFLSSFAAGLTEEQARVLKERGDAEGTLQELLRRKLNQTNNELEAQTRALGANIKEQEDLAHQTRLGAELQGDLAKATHKEKDERIKLLEAYRDKTIEERIKQVTATQQAQADAAKKQLADVGASAAAQIAETTGSMAALESSFAQRRGAIIAAADSDLKRQLALNKEPSLVGTITSSVEQKKQADLLSIQLERTKALTAARQQSRETEVNSLKAQETLAQAVVDIEQQRLQLLQQQQAPIAAQEAQQQTLLDAQQKLLTLSVENKQRQLAILADQISKEGLVGDKAAAVRAQETQITGELQKQRAALAAIGQQRLTPQLLQDRKNLLATITQENQVEQELRENRGQRAIQLQDQETNLRKQIADSTKELVLAQVTDTKLKPIVEIILKFEDQKKAIEDLIQKYPELESVGTQALNALEKATQASVDAAKTNQSAVANLAQSLSDTFVAGIDRSFDALFDTSKNFGERMQSLFAGIGEDMVKALLHSIITAPLKGALDSLIKSLSNSESNSGGGIGSIFGSLFGWIGRLFAPAAPVPAFAAGGLVKAGYASLAPPIPKDFLNQMQIPKFATGGTVKGPTLGLLGEGQEDEYIVPASQMSKLRKKDSTQQPVVNVHIAGDVVPRDPTMKPNDVITVTYADMDRGGKLSKAVTNIIKRNR